MALWRLHTPSAFACSRSGKLGRLRKVEQSVLDCFISMACYGLDPICFQDSRISSLHIERFEFSATCLRVARSVCASAHGLTKRTCKYHGQYLAFAEATHRSVGIIFTGVCKKISYHSYTLYMMQGSRSNPLSALPASNGWIM